MKNQIMFNEIEHSIVILRSKGVFKQTKAYARGGYIYAKHGSGFIRMCENGTSVPTVGIEAYDLGEVGAPMVTDLGYLVFAHSPDAKRPPRKT